MCNSDPCSTSRAQAMTRIRHVVEAKRNAQTTLFVRVRCLRFQQIGVLIFQAKSQCQSQMCFDWVRQRFYVANVEIKV